jgi:hypothetical protein
MLADAPDVDGSARTNRPLPEQPSKGNAPGEGSVGLPVRRVGLEQESFLVDRTGELCELADHFLRRCWEAAEEDHVSAVKRFFIRAIHQLREELTTFRSNFRENLHSRRSGALGKNEGRHYFRPRRFLVRPRLHGNLVQVFVR